MCKKTDVCGSIARVFLVVINLIFLVLGAAIFIVAAILRWSDLLNSVKVEISDLMGISDFFTVFDILLIVLLIFSGIVIFISLMGK